MERLYETTVILDPDLGKEEVDAEVGRLVDIIKNHSGEAEVTHVGKRSLEYPINNKSYGYYVFLVHGGDQAIVADLERQILINEKFLRHLTVKKDKFAPSDSYEAVEDPAARGSRGRSDQGRNARPKVEGAPVAEQEVDARQSSATAE